MHLQQDYLSYTLPITLSGATLDIYAYQTKDHRRHTPIDTVFNAITQPMDAPCRLESVAVCISYSLYKNN